MIADSIVSLTILVAIACLFYGPWQSACTDVMRQLLFEKRDRLFDIARQGALGFESKEYREIRNSINSAIRFSHELTLPRLYYLSFYTRKFDTAAVSDLKKAALTIDDPKLKNEIEQIIDHVEIIMITGAMAKSIQFWVFFPIALVFFSLAIWLRPVGTELSRWKEKLGERAQIAAECA
jgi:hypothetical protein